MKTVLWVCALPVVAFMIFAVPAARAGDDKEGEATALTDAQIEEKLETIIPVVDFTDANVKEVLHFLARQADVPIVFADGVEEVLEKWPKATVQLRNVPLKAVLESLLKGKGLTYRVGDGKIQIVVADEAEEDDEDDEE